MDNTAYEQARGITVKSSCISLQYIRQQQQGQSVSDDERSFLINLIDSPGHMDFSGEVSSALRMTDGCFLVVDAIEGVCIQTRAVLRQAWLEKVKPVLVINKIDKLFSQLQMTPDEAYRQLLRIVEQVNLVLGELWVEQSILDANSAHLAKLKASSNLEGEEDSEAGETIDVDDLDAANSVIDKKAEDSVVFEELEEFEFHPEKGNVVFASAFHGWGFSIENFVEMYANKLKMNRKILRKTLWGEFYFNPKTRKIATRRPNASAQTMFASLVLSNIHQIYSAILGSSDDIANTLSHKGYSSLTHRDTAKLEKIDKALALNVPQRELKNEDVNLVLSAFMGRWLPISNSLLEMATTLPSPKEAQQQRISILWHKSTHDLTQEGIDLQNRLETALKNADRTENAPLAAYVSKVFAVPNEQFAKNARIKLEPGKKTLIAMTRLFSGTLKVGDEVNLLGARYDPSTPEKHCKVAKIPQLWMLMGPDLQPIDKVQAGDVFGIGGEDLSLHSIETSETSENDSNSSKNASSPSSVAELTSTSTIISPDAAKNRDKQTQIQTRTILSSERNEFVSNIVKTATITNTTACPVFGALSKHVNPIVRVAVEPESPSDLEALESGMWLLHQADAAVHVEVQENGEFIIGALGELHLARCLELLKDEFARVPIKVSKPIVSFRETVLPGLAIDPETRATIPTELVVERTPDRQVTIVLRALRLPENVTLWLETHAEETRLVHQLKHGIQQQQLKSAESKESGATFTAEQIIEKWSSGLRSEFESSEEEVWRQQADFVWALGPHRVGPNVLLNNIPKYSVSKFWRGVLDKSTGSVPIICNPSDMTEEYVAQSNGYSREALTYFGVLQQLDSAIRSGFQLATRAGPLCEEPLMGVAVQILDINVVYTPHAQEEAISVSQNSFLLPDMCHGSASGQSQNYDDVSSNTIRMQLERGGNGGFGEDMSEDKFSSIWAQSVSLSGAVISATRSAIRRAFLSRPQRLYEAMYLAHVQVTAVHMGKAYAVLNRRRGDIISDEVNESSGLTLIACFVPAAEAFGFSEELVAKSGGAANAQLTFAKWNELEVDPNFIPTTEEELEEFGENIGGIAPNLARKYVDGVRKRKGLAVMEKLVDGANKQRTLSKKK